MNTEDFHMVLLETTKKEFNDKDVSDLKKLITKHEKKITEFLSLLFNLAQVSGMNATYLYKDIMLREEEYCVTTFKKMPQCLNREEHMAVMQHIIDFYHSSVPEVKTTQAKIGGQLWANMRERYTGGRHFTQRARLYARA